MSLSPRAPSFQSQPVFLLVFVNQYSSITLPSSILTSLSGSDPLFHCHWVFIHVCVRQCHQVFYISVSASSLSFQYHPVFLHICVNSYSFNSMPTTIPTCLCQPVLLHFNASQYFYTFISATPHSFQCQPVFLLVYASHSSFISMPASIPTRLCQPLLLPFNATQFSYMSVSACALSLQCHEVFFYVYVSQWSCISFRVFLHISLASAPLFQCRPVFLHASVSQCYFIPVPSSILIVCVSHCSVISMLTNIRSWLCQPVLFHFNAFKSR